MCSGADGKEWAQTWPPAPVEMCQGLEERPWCPGFLLCPFHCRISLTFIFHEYQCVLATVSPKPHIRSTVQYLFFCDWFISFGCIWNVKDTGESNEQLSHLILWGLGFPKRYPGGHCLPFCVRKKKISPNLAHDLLCTGNTKAQLSFEKTRGIFN